MSAEPSQSSATSLDAVLARDLEQKSLEVPLLPQVASEVLSSSLDDRANAQRLAELIERDQSLASHILRVVNSPAFRGSAEIVALKQAIARLGMERIREIALTISLRGSIFKPGRFASLVEDAWKRGLRTGLWSKEIARAARHNVEIAYLCGLLHNVGVPIMVNRICELDDEVDAATLTDLVGRYAPQAGAILVSEWRLPGVVADCINRLGLSDSADSDPNSRILSAGRHLCDLQTSDALLVENVVPQPAFQALNFYPDDIETLLGLAEQIQLTVESMA